MKKFSPRRFFILLLPSLLLFGLVTKATFFPPRGYSTQVLKVPPANGKFYRKGEIDTKVVITFSYSPFREWRNMLTRKGTLHAMGKVRFEDSEGNGVFPAVGYFSRFNWTGWKKTNSSNYALEYEFPMREIPKSVKNITLTTEVFDGNGWKLPISVPLKP